MKVLIVFVLILVSKASSDCTDSEAQNVKKCWLDYLANFGFDSVPPNEAYLEADVKFLYNNGPSGFYTQCDRVSKRNSCEAPFRKDCENTVGFMKSLNVSVSEATTYLVTDAIELWECTDGYNLTLSNYYCILQVDGVHFDQIKVCLNQFFGGLSSGVNCTVATDYVNCVSAVYNQYCGVSGKQFGCHWASVGAQVVVPPCTSSLPKCDPNQ